MAFPTKKPATAQATAPVAAPRAAAGDGFVASPKGSKPSHVLKAKVGKDGKFERITGLFEGVTKTGEAYLKGTDKNNDVSYIIMLNNFDEKQGK